MPASKLSDFDRAAISSLFFLGHEPGRKDRPIIYPKHPSHRPHLAYYGTTRSGKTFGIEYALRQLVDTRAAGFFFIDPHGSGYWRMASYLRQMDVTDRVLFWDLNDPDYVTTYDPFGFPDQSPSYIAGHLTATLLSTLGRQAETNEQPTLKTMTESGISALLELHLPFALAHRLLNPADTRFTKNVFTLLQQQNLLSLVAEMTKPVDRFKELGPVFKRLDNLFRDPRIRYGFTLAGVNFRQLMDEGWIVLVNAEPKDQHDDNITLYVRLLVKLMLMSAKQRHKVDETAPFFLAIDEASRYLTRDTSGILEQTAGYGLYLLVGMQSMKQAELESAESYAALQTCVQGEIVMRLVDSEEKEYFTKRFFGDRLDLKKIKHEEKTLQALPRTVEHPTTTRTSGTTTDGEGHVTHGQNEQEGSAYHTEYEYLENRQIWFYTPDELERMLASGFSRREPGQENRFGWARVGINEPTKIEIPELPKPMYDRDEMAAWLKTLKATQPFTLPLITAEKRFDALVHENLELVMKAVNQAGYDQRIAIQTPDPPVKPRAPKRPSRKEG